MIKAGYMTGLLLLFLCCVKDQMKPSDNQLVKQQNSNSMKHIPQLILSKNKFVSLGSDKFKHSVGGKEITQRTEVELAYDNEYLLIRFICRDNPYVDYNYYTEDNTALFNQEVFELFISPGQEDPENYLELQINPNNALFLGRVTNKFKSDHSFNLEYIDTKTAGVIHKVEKNAKDKCWRGELKIPFNLINLTLDSTSVYRLNMYRIISKQKQTDPSWTCNADNAVFACWNSTMASQPSFHKPPYFGRLELN